jgi:hypothetical protein
LAIKEQICDFFVKESQRNNSTSKVPIDMNGPFHSNWVGLLELINQLVIGKQHVHLITQTTLLEKTLEKILKDINTQVLETKYVTNLGQLLRIMQDIKRYIFKLVKSIQTMQSELVHYEPTCVVTTIDH